MQGNLVLSRKPGESIRTDGPATFTVERVKGRQVVVSIQAERGVKIRRGELPPKPDEREAA